MFNRKSVHINPLLLIHCTVATNAKTTKLNMKIETITIQNFKTFGLKPIIFSFNDLTSLIGENSVGKSNVLEALDVSFR